MLKALLLASLMRPGSVEPLREAVALLPDDADPSCGRGCSIDLAKRMMLVGRLGRRGGIERRPVAMPRDGSRESGCGSDWLLSNVHNTLGTGLAAIGEEAAGLAEYDLARDLARGNTKIELRYFINYSDVLHLTGRYQDSVDEALAGIELARSKGLERSIGAMLAGNAAEPMIALGQWEPAYAMIKRALELDPPAHHTAHLRLLQAWLQIWRGELDEADAILGEFRKMIVDGHHAPQYASQVIRTDTEHALAVGDHERAWANVTVFLERWDIYHCAWTYPLLALAAAAAAALDHADRTGRAVPADRAGVRRPARAQDQHPAVLAAGDHRRAGRHGRRLAHRAGAAATGCRCPPICRRTPGLRLAQHLVAARERAEAKVVLGTAVERATALGARLLVDRLAALTQRAGFAVASESTPTPAGRADFSGDRGAAAGGGRPLQRRDRHAPCSSAPRPPASTCPTSWPSSASAVAARPPRSRTGLDWSRLVLREPDGHLDGDLVADRDLLWLADGVLQRQQVAAVLGEQ